MGWLSALLDKKKLSEPDASGDSTEDQPVPFELEAAISALQAGDGATALERARAYVETGDLALRVDANRVCALALSRERRYTEAFAYWLRLFEYEPSAHNALQLATTSVMCGEIDRGEAWLLQCHHINRQSREMPSMVAVTNFIATLAQAGEWTRARPYLDNLKKAYTQCKVTDATFLHLRGLPSFDIFFDRSLPILSALLAATDVRRWYGSMMGMLDAEGEAMLLAWMSSTFRIAN